MVGNPLGLFVGVGSRRVQEKLPHPELTFVASARTAKIAEDAELASKVD